MGFNSGFKGLRYEYKKYSTHRDARETANDLNISPNNDNNNKNKELVTAFELT